MVAQIDGTVVKSSKIPSPQATEGVVGPEVEMRSLEEEPQELVVAFLDFLQNSNVPLLKYLDRKRGKYAISKEAGFYVELIRNSTHIKQAAAMKTTEEMKRECEEVTAKVAERVASLTSKCATRV